MTREEALTILREEILRIAPEADFTGVADGDDLRDGLDLDSMDIFNLVIALSKRLRVDIPDADAGRLVTLDGGADYLLGAHRHP
ncbi:acyl carrier protein [Sphingomonas sp. GCM10030256]|uniref:acyl carrier protein n=1 Tax=Sphingomonas sp. GCM10030256 TaxID=3273427 RepID=UPI00360E3127